MKLSRFSAAYTALAVLAISACDGTGNMSQTATGPNEIPAVASLKIVTVAIGLAQDPDGYTCYLDGSLGATKMRASDTHYIRPVTAGRHEVRLGDLAEGCSVIGPNPVVVDIPNNRQAEVVFEVWCESIPE